MIKNKFKDIINFLTGIMVITLILIVSYVLYKKIDLTEDHRFTLSKQTVELVKNLEGKFKIEMYKNVSLFTIRHFNEKSIKKVSNNRKLVLEQRTEKTVRLIFSN